MNRLFQFFVFASLLGCQRSTPGPDAEGYACGKIIQYRLAKLSLPVAYSRAIDGYYVGSDTVSTDPIGIFCNLPETYKVVGKTLTFDGSFAPISDTTGTEGQLVKAFSNRRVYHLSVTRIY